MSEWLDEEELVILNFLYDVGQPWSCTNWGTEGNDRLPLIINDGDFDENGLDSFFFEQSSPDDLGVVPIYIFIDKELKLHYKQRGYMSEAHINFMIMEILDED